VPNGRTFVDSITWTLDMHRDRRNTALGRTGCTRRARRRRTRRARSGVRGVKQLMDDGDDRRVRPPISMRRSAPTSAKDEVHVVHGRGPCQDVARPAQRLASDLLCLRVQYLTRTSHRRALRINGPRLVPSPLPAEKATSSSRSSHRSRARLPVAPTFCRLRRARLSAQPRSASCFLPLDTSLGTPILN